MRAEPRGCGRTHHRVARVASSPLVPLIVARHLSLRRFPQQNWPFPLQRLNLQLGSASLCVQQQPQRI